MTKAACPHCHEPVRLKDNFCAACGHTLKSTTDEARPAQSQFFITSPTKAAILSVSTLGLYELYWMYRQWEHIRDAQGTRMRPFWRMTFWPFYIYPLFKHLGISRPRWFAGIYIGLQLASMYPPGWTAYVGLFTFYLIYQAQLQVNAAQNAPSGTGAHWTVRSIAAIVLGLGFWAFCLSFTYGVL